MAAEELNHAPGELNHLDEEVDEFEVIDMNQPMTLTQSIISSPEIIARPDTNWHIHKGPNFISYVHISSEDIIQIDRYVKFLSSSEEPQIFLRGKRVLPQTKVSDTEDVSSLLLKISILAACPGAGADGIR